MLSHAEATFRNTDPLIKQEPSNLISPTDLSIIDNVDTNINIDNDNNNDQFTININDLSQLDNNFAAFATPFIDSLTTLNDNESISKSNIKPIQTSSATNHSPRTLSSASSILSPHSSISSTSSSSSSASSTSSSIKKKTPPEKRRVRTGCLTCRSKHKKCDETKPICKFCLTKNLQCIWPSIGNSKPNQLSDKIKKLISNNNSIVKLSSNPKFLNLNSNLKSLLSIIISLNNGDFSSNLNSFIFFNDKSSKINSSINSNFPPPLISMLFNYFLSDPSSILQLNNSTHLISLSQSISTNTSSSTKFLHYAILALSSRVLEQFDPNYNGIHTLDFYNLSIIELSNYLKDKINEILNNNLENKIAIWWTLILICWFELISINPLDFSTRFKNLLEFFQLTKIFDDSNNYSIKLLLRTFLIPWSIKSENSNLINLNDLIDSNNELYLQKISSFAKNDFLTQNFQTFFIHNQSDISWIDLWNSIHIHHFNIDLSDHIFIQSENSIILDSGESLNDALLYHTSCYSLLLNKPKNVHLSFQSQNDINSVIAYSNTENSNFSDNYDALDLANIHYNSLIKIINSNMLVKSDKSIYNLYTTWYTCYILNDRKSNDAAITLDSKAIELSNILNKIYSWSNLQNFKWLIQSFNSQPDNIDSSPL